MKLRYANKSDFALTLTEVLIVVVVLLVFALLIWPALYSPRTAAYRVQCVNNLRQAGLAFRWWANDHADNFPMQISITNGGTLELLPNGIASAQFRVISNELVSPKSLVCPRDRDRQAAQSFNDLENTNLSYFICLNADHNARNNILSGDRNLEIAGFRVRSGLVQVLTNSIVSWAPTIHTNCGNVLFTDGHVEQLNNTGKRGLSQVFRLTGVATNRLAMP